MLVCLNTFERLIFFFLTCTLTDDEFHIKSSVVVYGAKMPKIVLLSKNIWT